MDRMTKTEVHDQILSHVSRAQRSGDKTDRDIATERIMNLVNIHVNEMQHYTAESFASRVLRIKRNFFGWVSVRRLKMVAESTVDSFAVPER